MIWVKAQSGMLVNLANVVSISIVEEAGDFSVATKGESSGSDEHLTLFSGTEKEAKYFLEELMKRFDYHKVPFIKHI